jgi:poly(3-hydroxybutyrate) depolymerase
MAKSNQPSAFPDRRAFLRPLAACMLALALLAGGCSGRSAAEPYHHTSPSDFYLYTPPNYEPGVPLQLVLALHGPEENALECFNAWRQDADDSGIVILCPALPYSDGVLDRTGAQLLIGTALQAAYNEVSLQGTFFIIGLGEAGTLALEYASQFPQAITGVAAVASSEFPSLTARGAQLPILVLAASEDRTGTEAAQSFVDGLMQQGGAVRLVTLDERGDRLTPDDTRLTVEFLGEILR